MSTSAQNRRPNLTDILATLTALAITLLHMAQVAYFPYLLHDVALYVSMGQRIASGAIPYVDVVDTNPPMIMYLSSLPALVSKVFSLPLAMTALAFFMLVILALGAAFLFALKAADPNISRAALALNWFFWVWAAIWVYSQGIYAEREQFIALFMAGFFVIRAARYRGAALKPAQAIPFGVLAAIGIGMKPHYLLPWLGAELFLAAWYKKLRGPLFSPEIAALAATGLAYLGHFFVIPGMSSYYTYWIPLFSRGYGVFDASWREMFNTLLLTRLGWLWLAVLLAFGAGIYFYRGNKSALLALPGTFVIVSLLTMVVYVVQKKGWYYQSVGFDLALVTASGILLAEFLQDADSPKTKSLAALTLAGILIYSLAPLTASVGEKITAQAVPLQTPSDPYTELIDHLTRPNESVMFLTTSVGNVFPAITYSGRINASRFGMAVPLASILSDASKSGINPAWQADEEIYYNGVLADLEKFSPRAVMVSNSKEGVTSVTILRYFERQGFFQTTLAGYSCVGKIDNFVIYLRLPPHNDPAYQEYVNGVLYLYDHKLVADFPPDCALQK